MAKILVVDDAVLDRRIAGACVEEHGSSAVYAQDGREALQVIERGEMDRIWHLIYQIQSGEPE